MHDPSTSAGAAAPAAGWFADPDHPGQLRWWDGTAWTSHVTPVPSPAQCASGKQSAPAKDAPLFARQPNAIAAPRPAAIISATWTRHRIVACVGLVAGLPMLGYGLVDTEQLVTAPLLGEVSRGFFVLIGVAVAFAFPGTQALRAWLAARRQYAIDFLAERGLDGQPFALADTAAARAILPFARSSITRKVSVEHAASGTVRGFSATCGTMLVEFTIGKQQHRELVSFVATRLPPAAAARHPGVSVRPRANLLGIADGQHRKVWGDGIGGNSVAFESEHVARSYDVRVDPTGSQLATFELFDPTMLDFLSRQPVAWDQVGDLLVVLCLDDSARSRFDRLCDAAAIVAHAYWGDQE